MTLSNSFLVTFLIAWVGFGWFLVVSPETVQRWALKHVGGGRIRLLRAYVEWARRFVASDAWLVQTRVIGVVMCLLGLLILTGILTGYWPRW